MPLPKKETPSETSAAILATQAAIALADRAHETASALAKAKNESDISAAVIANDIVHIKDNIVEIKKGIKEITDGYVTHTEFREALSPLRSIIYGLVATVLMAVLGAIVMNVLK